MRILVVTNAYPAPERPSFGIYVARLVTALEPVMRRMDEAKLHSKDGCTWPPFSTFARAASSAGP